MSRDVIISLFRWACVVVAVVAAFDVNVMSESTWQAVVAPMLVLFCAFAWLFSHPLQRYLNNPAKFAADAKAARRKANERGSSYDGGAD